jgi:hypothetical protein
MLISPSILNTFGAKRRRSTFCCFPAVRQTTSKYLNFPPYGVIGIKLKSMITDTNTAVKWSNLVCIERGEPQLSIYSMKNSFTLQPRDLCRLKKLVWGCQICPLWELFKLWFHKNYCFHKNHLTCNGYRKIWWISTENLRVKSLLFLVFWWPPKKGTICVAWAHSGHSRKNGGRWKYFRFFYAIKTKMPKKLGSILWHQNVNFFDDHKRETLNVLRESDIGFTTTISEGKGFYLCL